MAKRKNTTLSYRADIQDGGNSNRASNPRNAISRLLDFSGPETAPHIVDQFATIKRPKLKFNYTMTIKFRNPIDIESITTGVKSDDSRMSDEVTFALKQATRPNPTINYQDINFYNYRTKVATKMDYGAMTLTFYDDVSNYAHNMYELYLKSISPIASKRKEEANTIYSGKEGPQNMNFNLGGGTNYAGGSGSIGPLQGIADGGESGLIENISIRHWFYSQLERRGDEGSTEGTRGYDPNNIQYIEYQFINPKISNMTLDELDMTQSDVNTVMMSFNYDSVYIDSPRAENAPELSTAPPASNVFTLGRVLSKVRDAERLINRFRRLDTIPDISVLSTIGSLQSGGFLPPLTNPLPEGLEIPEIDIDFPITFGDIGL